MITDRQRNESTEQYHQRLASRAPSIDCAQGVVSFHFGSDDEARAFYEAMTAWFEEPNR